LKWFQGGAVFDERTVNPVELRMARGQQT